MAWVIVNEAGEMYGGFGGEKAKPIWFKTHRAECDIQEEGIADMAVRQLKSLGYEKIVKRAANGVIRKWVPADLDASAV